MEYTSKIRKWGITFLADLFAIVFLLPVLSEPLDGLLAVIPGAVMLIILPVSYILFARNLRKLLKEKNIDKPIAAFVFAILSFLVIVAGVTFVFGLASNAPRGVQVLFPLLMIASVIPSLFYIAPGLSEFTTDVLGIFAGHASEDDEPKTRGSFFGGSSDYSSSFGQSDRSYRDDEYNRDILKQIKALENENDRSRDNLAKHGSDKTTATADGVRNAINKDMNDISINNKKIEALRKKLR